MSVFTTKVEYILLALGKRCSRYIFRYFTPNNREVLDTRCLWLQVAQSKKVSIFKLFAKNAFATLILTEHELKYTFLKMDKITNTFSYRHRKLSSNVIFRVVDS